MTVNLDPNQSVYRELTTDTKFIDTTGSIYELTHLDENTDEITLKRIHSQKWNPDDNAATLTLSAATLRDHPDLIRVDPHAINNPRDVILKYAEKHLNDDVRTIGREHTHNGADVSTIGDIDYAIWKLTQKTGT